MAEPASPQRVLSAMLFNRLCAMTGMSGNELCRLLERELHRSHEMQASTLRGWRTGHAAVPVEALLVVADAVKFRLPGLEMLLLGEVIDDEQRRREAYRQLVERERDA